MLRNLESRQTIENMMPPGAAKESQLLALDEAYYVDMAECKILDPWPSFAITLRDKIDY